MKLEDLNFEYPEALVATERSAVSRVMVVDGNGPSEWTPFSQVFDLFRPGDVLVINDTKVLKRRVFTESGLEILFISPSVDRREWEVLCPASRWKNGSLETLPEGVQLELLRRGRPQSVRASQPLTDEYFEKNGELPLPPYIQKARGERKNRSDDGLQYQTEWGHKAGSLAAPTASLHFSNEHLQQLKNRGVHILKITLHVGLGTFLPVTTDRLEDHLMHGEVAEVSNEVWNEILKAKSEGRRVAAVGTTVARTLESVAHQILNPGEVGETRLFIRPGFEYRTVDILLTNFHQPKSTLFALVAAFAGLDRVQSSYAWAIEKKFKLFSYGDLSVWMR